MDTEYHSPTPLRAVFDGAKDFGLTEDEVWGTVDASMYEVGGDASVTELIDELSAALAHRAVSKQRREQIASA